MKVLVTGAAGFIGMHCAQRLLARGDTVIGVDNLSDYYSVDLKRARLKQLEPARGFRFLELGIAAPTGLARVFEEIRPDAVLHLAAQPGVRYSLTHPEPYFQTNLVGFGRLLEVCRHRRPKHLVLASRSSFLGANRKLPWSEADNVDHPVSLYAATKKSNELLAHAYCLPEWSLGYVYLPAMAFIVATSVPLAPLGARLAHHLPVKPLGILYALTLLALALRMARTV